MKANERIIKWLNEMINKFEWISFKYEYSSEMKAHLVCVYPQKEIDQCDEYSTEEVDFNFKMDELYPNETLLFSTEEQLFSCSDNAPCFKKAAYSKAIIITDKTYSFADDNLFQNLEYYDCEYISHAA